MEITEEVLKKKAIAPRVTLEALEANIIAEHYFTAYEGRMGSIVEGTYESIGAKAGQDIDLDSLQLLTFCVLVLANGYTVHGVSACASKANFNAEIGKSIARANAVNQIWPLMGYELKTKLHHQDVMEQDDGLGRAITQLTAHSFGNASALKPEDAKLILDELIPQNLESNASIAKIVQAGIKAWSELQGDEDVPGWSDLPEHEQAVWIDTVSYFRANPDPVAGESFEQKMVRELVKASIAPPLTPASQKKPHLRVV